MRVLPWLTLGATLLFAFGKKLAGGRRSVIEHETTGAALLGATLFQLAVAVYGGYFGGGMGIVMLAMLAVLGMTDVHAMNALKSVLGFVINGVAVVTFIMAGAVYWKHGIIMIVGAVVGGYLGAHFAMKMPQVLDPRLRGAGGRRDDDVLFLEIVLKTLPRMARVLTDQVCLLSLGP